MISFLPAKMASHSSISKNRSTIYRTTVQCTVHHTPPAEANPDGKGCLTVSKIIKEAQKHMFLNIVSSMGKTLITKNIGFLSIIKCKDDIVCRYYSQSVHRMYFLEPSLAISKRLTVQVIFKAPLSHIHSYIPTPPPAPPHQLIHT
jgi:hypothetical protein